MANRLAKLTLSVIDYTSKESAVNIFPGEVVSIDFSTKTQIYRFYQEETGALMVSIDYSKDKIIIQERNEMTNMTLELEKGKVANCIYRFDANNTLHLNAIASKIEINENGLLFEYDLYNPNDMENPITKNKVEIHCEANNLC